MRDYSVRFVSRLFGVLVALLMLSACAQAPREPNYYTLTAEPAAVAGVQTSVSLGIWPVELPDLLDRSGIVSYEQPRRVRISTANIWAGALDENITRVVGTEIGNRLPAAELWSYPWDSRQRPAYQLRISIDSLAGQLGGPVELQASWVLNGGEGNDVVARGRADLRQDVEGEGYDAYVGAINRALSQFAGQLAVRVGPLLR